MSVTETVEETKTRWQLEEERRERIREGFASRVASIARLIPGNWRVNRDQDKRWNVEISSDNRGTIYFSQQEHDRIEITVGYPKGVNGDHYYGERCRMTVTERKPDKIIAQEIGRRLLPKYLPELLKAVESLNQGDANTRALEAATAEVRRRLDLGPEPDNLPHWKNDNNSRTLHSPGSRFSDNQPFTCGWEAKIHYYQGKEDCTVELHGIDHEAVIRVLSLFYNKSYDASREPVPCKECGEIGDDCYCVEGEDPPCIACGAPESNHDADCVVIAND
jgi:hypothetical protein